MTPEAIAAAVAGFGLLLNAYALMRTLGSRRLLNYQELTRSHRDLWKMTLETPNPFERVLDPDADLTAKPVSYAERRFVNLLLLHMTTAFAFSKSNDIVPMEQLATDFHDVLRLPIPRFVWSEAKHYFNRDFVAFVEDPERAQGLLRRAWSRLKAMPSHGHSGRDTPDGPPTTRADGPDTTT